MSEEERARDFNLELDRRLSGEKGAAFGPGTSAMETAGRLARADFSGDSGIRDTLRERLLAKNRGVVLKFHRRNSRRILRLTMAVEVPSTAIVKFCDYQA